MFAFVSYYYEREERGDQIGASTCSILSVKGEAN
jgi:hypothetical protein